MLIQCLSIEYEINGETKVVTHGSSHISVMNKKKKVDDHKKVVNLKRSMRMDEFEHIENVECTYS